MGLKFSALDKLISLMKSADYYLDSKINQEIDNRVEEINNLKVTATPESNGLMSSADKVSLEALKDLGFYVDDDGDICQR